MPGDLRIGLRRGPPNLSSGRRDDINFPLQAVSLSAAPSEEVGAWAQCHRDSADWVIKTSEPRVVSPVLCAQSGTALKR